MALLVKERKALEATEKSIANYYEKFLGVSIDIPVDKTIEERLLFLCNKIDGLWHSI